MHDDEQALTRAEASDLIQMVMRIDAKLDLLLLEILGGDDAKSGTNPERRARLLKEFRQLRRETQEIKARLQERLDRQGHRPA